MQSSRSAQEPRLSRHEVFREEQLREFMQPEYQAQIWDKLGFKDGFEFDCKGDVDFCPCE